MSGPKEKEPGILPPVDIHQAFTAFRRLVSQIKPPTVEDTSGTVSEEESEVKAGSSKDPGSKQPREG